MGSISLTKIMKEREKNKGSKSNIRAKRMIPGPGCWGWGASIAFMGMHSLAQGQQDIPGSEPSIVTLLLLLK